MKATGIIRDVDEMGRFVIPKELRTAMGIRAGSPMEVFTEGDTIILKKYKPFCIFCDSSESLINYNGKKICAECVSKMNAMAKFK